MLMLKLKILSIFVFIFVPQFPLLLSSLQFLLKFYVPSISFAQLSSDTFLKDSSGVSQSSPTFFWELLPTYITLEFKQATFPGSFQFPKKLLMYNSHLKKFANRLSFGMFSFHSLSCTSVEKKTKPQENSQEAYSFIQYPERFPRFFPSFFKFL